MGWIQFNIAKIGGFMNFASNWIIMYLGENPLRCTIHDEKGLVLTEFVFYPIFWSP
jgi:hypothetical protein